MMLKVVETKHGRRLVRSPLMFLAIAVLAVAGMVMQACDVESGDRTPARRDDDKTGEFHRSPVAAFEQFRIDVTNDDTGCAAEPADVNAELNQRVRLAIQLQGAAITSTGTGSTSVEGERDKVKYEVSGLQISSSGGAFGTGVTAIDLDLESGTRRTYDFNTANAGEFDILCNGEKVGTFAVSG